MQPLHTKSADGTVLLSAAGVLLASSNAANDENHPPEGRQRAAAVVANLLNAAHKEGFKQRDILQTLLQRGERSDRVRQMAQQSCAVIPKADLIEIVRQSLAIGSDEE